MLKNQDKEKTVKEIMEIQISVIIFKTIQLILKEEIRTNNNLTTILTYLDQINMIYLKIQIIQNL